MEREHISGKEREREREREKVSMRETEGEIDRHGRN